MIEAMSEVGRLFEEGEYFVPEMLVAVPGGVIPDAVVERLRKTPQKQKRAEGKRICVEIIQQVREIEGVAGVHVMAYRQEELVAELIDEAGLLPRPKR